MASTSFNIGDTEQQINSLSEHIVTLDDKIPIMQIISDYTTNNAYNTWTDHNVTASTLTQVSSAAICISDDRTKSNHEARIYYIDGNKIYYQVKGGWSGGYSGVKVKITAFQ